MGRGGGNGGIGARSIPYRWFITVPGTKAAGGAGGNVGLGWSAWMLHPERKVVVERIKTIVLAGHTYHTAT